MSNMIKRKLMQSHRRKRVPSLRGILGILGWDRFIRENHWIQVMSVLVYRVADKIVIRMFLDLGHIYKLWVKSWTHQGRHLTNDPCSFLLLYDMAADAKWKAQNRASWIWKDQKNSPVLFRTIWLLLLMAVVIQKISGADINGFRC
ncbi:hypothetical protein HanIR_Chr09g0390971 [Helianthus annuus]|nr:hypothetical protein HanIR_Chr09g0390971 [Helianthus annuus]